MTDQDKRMREWWIRTAFSVLVLVLFIWAVMTLTWKTWLIIVVVWYLTGRIKEFAVAVYQDYWHF